jgi:L,D-peptidoglycan transpeptidase YkuD (ErfK/YbiS/YcfS/YnhG family)
LKLAAGLLLLAACTSSPRALTPAPAMPPDAAPLPAAPARAVSPVPATASQLIVVVAPDWTSTSGRLRRFVRAGDGWRADGEAIDVTLGRTGLAWGRGLHGDAREPAKVEGDGKTPAGVFALGTGFGVADAGPGGTLPYQPSGPGWRCVDDPASTFYNRIVDRGAVQPDWKSAELMRRDDGLYDWGIELAHNQRPVKSGGGSCVFFHIWSGAGLVTAGCVAMAAGDMRALQAWSHANTVAIIMPRPIYAELQSLWSLPGMEAL